MAQAKAKPDSSNVPWRRQSHFSYPHGKDAVGVPLTFGKCLVLGENGNPSLYEWNLRRSFPFSSPIEARFGGMAVNWNEEALFLLGGVASNPGGLMLSSVERFVLDRDDNPDWKWTTAWPLPTPCSYAAAVAIPTEGCVVVLGGRNGNWQEMDSLLVGRVDDSNAIQEWTTAPQAMPGPRMGCAAVLLNETNLLVCGGYDGRMWSNTCWLYEWPQEHVEQGVWKELPPMLETVRFVKAVRYYGYVLVVGEKEDLSSSSTIACVQCWNTQTQEWIWLKNCSCPPLDLITLQGPYLYGLSAGSPNEENDAGIYSCELSQLDPQMVQNALPLAVGTTATADIEAPTIVAMEAVLVPEVEGTAITSASNVEEEEGNIKLRNVVKVKLNEKSYYTGQLRKKDGAYIPHGQGLLVWVEDNEDNNNNPQQQGPSSYYKGQFYNGYRHGLGEMYLRGEDKHYFGSFEYGSWQGIGTLKLRSKGFSYFGNFASGEMTGKGRCSFRVGQGQQQQKTYAGGFHKGLAHGKGVVADYLSGKIELDQEFHEEDLFQLGAAASPLNHPT